MELQLPLRNIGKEDVDRQLQRIVNSNTGYRTSDWDYRIKESNGCWIGYHESAHKWKGIGFLGFMQKVSLVPCVALKIKRISPRSRLSRQLRKVRARILKRHALRS